MGDADSMNSKNIAKSLKKKLDDWCANIEEEKIRKLVLENAIVTGGALVSLLNGEPPHDYDVYFKTMDSLHLVAKYYADRWNSLHPEKSQVEIKCEDGRVTSFIRSKGVAAENENADPDGNMGIEGETEPEVAEDAEVNKPKYRPTYFTTNAISLSEKIQIVIRFYGDVNEIHQNYDFVHCTCSYDYRENKVNLPARALEAIINKELFYIGSRYPLCSIIRTRKFVGRGWTINAGQYLKMALQLNELNLKDFNTFKDQLAGVDSAYFEQAIRQLSERQEKEPDFKVDNTYLFEVINRIF